MKSKTQWQMLIYHLKYRTIRLHVVTAYFLSLSLSPQRPEINLYIYTSVYQNYVYTCIIT